MREPWCSWRKAYGDVAEWLRSGLQNRLHRFNSGRRLHFSGNIPGHPAWTGLKCLQSGEALL
jgi:hypothetical protein